MESSSTVPRILSVLWASCATLHWNSHTLLILLVAVTSRAVIIHWVVRLAFVHDHLGGVTIYSKTPTLEIAQYICAKLFCTRWYEAPETANLYCDNHHISQSSCRQSKTERNKEKKEKNYATITVDTNRYVNGPTTLMTWYNQTTQAMTIVDWAPITAIGTVCLKLALAAFCCVFALETTGARVLTHAYFTQTYRTSRVRRRD